MFEFAFMPIVLECIDNKDKFHAYIPDYMIVRIMSTFFSKFKIGINNETIPLNEEIWISIYKNLE